MADQLVDYIRDALSKGYQEAELRSLLRSQGWQEPDLDRAFALVRTPAAPPEPPPPSLQPSPGISSQQQGPTATELSDIPDLFRNAFDLCSSRIWTMIGIELLQMVMFIPVVFLFAIIVGVMVALTGLRLHAGGGIAALGGTLIVFITVFIAVAMVIGSWTVSAMMTSLRDAREGIGALDSYRRGWPFIWTMLGATILQALCVLGGFILLIIPGVIFAIWFSLTSVVVVTEGSSAGGALSRSKALIEGFWWGVFLRFLVLGIAMIVIYLVPFLLLTFLGAKTPFPGSIFFALLANLVQVVLGLLLTPYAYVYLYSLYLDLRRIKG